MTSPTQGDGRERREKIEPPEGFRFDPFADARMGKSLFQMEPEDWLVRVADDAPTPEGGRHDR